jgi:hypothetical protein
VSTDSRPQSRRQILAFIALTGDEAVAPNEVRIHQWRSDDRDWQSVDLVVDTEAAVRFWVGVYGHDPAALEDEVRTLPDGARYQLYQSRRVDFSTATSDGPTARITTVCARIDLPADEPLDDATREQLAALAEPATQESA